MTLFSDPSKPRVNALFGLQGQPRTNALFGGRKNRVFLGGQIRRALQSRRRTVGFLNCVPGNHISTPYMRNDKNDPTIPVKNDIKGVKILILVSFRESWRDD